MKMAVRFDGLVCGTCKNKPSEPGVVDLDYMAPDIVIPGDENRPARKVTIKVTQIAFEDRDDGSVHGHLIARVPCMNCEGEHELDVTDVYRAPKLHLENASLCLCGEKMTFAKTPSWTYKDDGEHGGTIEVKGILSCAKCHRTAMETLRFAADMAAALRAGAAELSLTQPIPGSGTPSG